MKFRILSVFILKYGLILALIFPSYYHFTQPDLPFLSFLNATVYVANQTVLVNLPGSYYSVFPVLSFGPPENVLYPKGLERVVVDKKIPQLVVDGDVVFFVDDQIDLASHYFHFMEHLIGVWNYLAYQHPERVKLIFFAFPQYTSLDHTWVGKNNNINLLLLNALFPNAKIYVFNQIPQNLKIKAENVYVSSRIRSHGLPGSNFANMNGDARWGYIPERLRMMRDRVFASMDVKVQAPTDTLRITYSQRTSGRIMEPKLEAKLLQAIAQQPNVSLKVVDFGKISFKEQLQLVANTDLFMGVHGNGFTHLLFLPDHATVLEYHEGEHSPFYRLFAQARGLHYYGNVRDRWVTEENTSLDNSYQNHVLEIDLPGTIALINQLSAENKS